MSLSTSTTCDNCGRAVVKRGRNRETVAGIIFLMVAALAVVGAREGAGLRIGLACFAYLVYLEWWTWHGVVWDPKESEESAEGT